MSQLAVGAGYGTLWPTRLLVQVAEGELRSSRVLAVPAPGDPVMPPLLYLA